MYINMDIKNKKIYFAFFGPKMMSNFLFFIKRAFISVFIKVAYVCSLGPTKIMSVNVNSA